MSYIYVVYNTETCPDHRSCNDLIDPPSGARSLSAGARNLFTSPW